MALVPLKKIKDFPLAGGIDDRIKSLFAEFGANSVNEIRQNIKKAGKQATGKTARALSYTATARSLQVSGPAWVWTLETGRGPYSGGQKGGFAKRLEEWMVAKGVKPFEGKTLSETARFLAWYINKFGSKLYRQGGRTDIITPVLDEANFIALNNRLQQIAQNKTLGVIEPEIKSIQRIKLKASL